MKARALIRNGTARLKDSPAIDHWQKGREKIEAEILLIDLMGEEPDPDDKISASKQRRYEEWIERRFTGEPVAHITGVTDFRGLDLIVKPVRAMPAIPAKCHCPARRPATKRIRGRAGMTSAASPPGDTFPCRRRACLDAPPAPGLDSRTSVALFEWTCRCASDPRPCCCCRCSRSSWSACSRCC